jgi:uncharacterized protein (DUF1015 family)
MEYIDMSKIIPFAALLPKPELAQKIISPPYDVINSLQARIFVADNPYSLLHITKAEVDFPSDVSEYDDRVYERARLNFVHFMNERWLSRDRESLYVYRIEYRGHAQTGVVCGVSVDEYDNALIKRHEKTKKEKEDDRTRFAYTINAHAEPVFLVFKSNPHLKGLIAQAATQKPLYDLVDHADVKHILWRVMSTPELVSAFAELDAIYIADGHHRSACASRVRDMKRRENPIHTGAELYNYFPAVVFPHDEVRIYRYNWDGDPGNRPLADVTITDVMDIADHGGIMPPKSTWFAPKLTSGLFVYTF